MADNLEQAQILDLLAIMAAHRPIVVGGQSIALHAAMHADDPALRALGPLTSKDLDLHENEGATTALAASLIDGRVHRPGSSDFTPEAAKVTGRLGGLPVVVDFMRSIKGVDADRVPSRAVEIEDPLDPTISLVLMHPLDCLRSRLANVNDLHRDDPQTLDQAEASIRILQLFIEDDLGNGADGAKRVTRIAQEMEHVLVDLHWGRPTHLEHGHRLDPIVVLQGLVDDRRLDARWRDMTLGGILDRSIDKSRIETERRRQHGLATPR